MAATSSYAMDTAEERLTLRLPSTLEEFVNAVNSDQKAWYNRFIEANTLFDQTTIENSKLRQRLSRAQEKINSLTNEITHQQGLLEYQKKETDRITDRLTDRFNAEIRRIENGTKENEHNQPEPPPPMPSPSFAPVLGGPAEKSERLPDPDKFTGQRTDLRRFISQIHEKMTVNRDRYPTPSVRMSYVTSRLSGIPYAQILPYIEDGVCRLNDYREILNILEKSYGEPNLMWNARSELLRIRQGNREFSAFFAEFQRLGLESQLPDESLSTCLEESISNELHDMKLHSPPPSRQYHELAAHFQELENRKRDHHRGPARSRYQSSAPRYQMPTHQPSMYQNPRQPSPTPSLYSSVVARNTPAPQRVTERITEPMDLSSTRRTNLSDKETGNCFRCHQSGHRIRNCPLPDNRPQNSQRRNSGYQVNAISRSPSPESSRSSQRQIAYQTQASPSRQPGPADHIDDGSENGVRLG